MTAFQLVKTLKHLAEQGRNIITTIHQPRSEIWGLFDNLIILTKGETAYSGPADECLTYFNRLGYELPPFVNPADYLIDISAVDMRTAELEASSSARVEHIKNAWKENCHSSLLEKSHPTPISPPGDIPDVHHELPSFVRQVWALTRRTWIVTVRDRFGMTGSLLQAFIMGVVMGLIFLRLSGSLSGIRSRESALYTAAALQGYLVLVFENYRLTDGGDIQLFDREYKAGFVSIPAFLISRRLARALLEDIPVPLVFSLVFYFMTGLTVDGGQFLLFFAVMLLEQYIAVCLAMLCVALTREFAGASLIGNLVYTLQTMACGFFVNPVSMPVYVRWTRYVAYVRYAFAALCVNEFRDRLYDCPNPGGSANPACAPYTGRFILESLNIPRNWILTPILALIGFALAFYVGAGLVLRILKNEIKISRARPSRDHSTGKEKIIRKAQVGVREISISLEKYAISVQKRNWYGKGVQEKVILKPITAEFKPGSLNVIMGPSGSGKTTLLNSVAARLQDDFTTTWGFEGKVLFNNAVPSERVLRSVVAYVAQDDTALLASLTVRETLRFAAGLRLPSWMSKEEKNERAEMVLMKMGLKDCAEHFVGSELIRGISGGEKRRVSMAVQLLSDPRVLLLDEPTSGLDAFTAASIIEVLEGLANEGRTLILTIHQSRSDLWTHFRNIVLLARGGHLVYAGAGLKMIDYFASKDYQCPQNTNPADFALDLITVDLQDAGRETATRKKIQGLIDQWKVGDVQPSEKQQVSTPAELGAFKRSTASFQHSFPILVHRSLLQFWRRPELTVARIMQVVGMGIVLSLFFAPLKNNYFSVQDRMGFVQQILPLYFVGMLQNVAIYPHERDVFYREHDDCAYGVEAFFLQYTAIEVPFAILASLIFALLADFACNLKQPRTASLYFIVVYNSFCIVSCGESLGIFFNTLFSHTGFAVNAVSVVLSIGQIMAGIMSIDMPAFLKAMNYLSPLKYSAANLAPYSFRGQKFTCEDAQRLPDGRCPIETGEQALELFKLDHDSEMNVMALAVCALVYRVVAYAVLKAKRERWVSRLWRVVAAKRSQLPPSR